MADAATPKPADAAPVKKDKKAAKEAKRERRAAAKVQQEGQTQIQGQHSSGPVQTGGATGAGKGRPEKPAMSKIKDAAPTPSLDEDLSTVGVLGDASLFGNVTLPRNARMNAINWSSAAARGVIHPAVLTLCHQLSTFAIRGANQRAIAVLRALGEVIRDYKTPQGAVLSRDLLTRVSQQVGFIVESRPLNTATGHAVRFLKYEISVVEASLSEEDAKEHLLGRIEHFIRDRIVYAAKVIQSHAAAKIHDGEVVMTYAHSSVIEGTLLQAFRQGRQFEVIVVDSRPLYEGRQLAERLLEEGIPTTYGLLTSLSTLAPRATLVLLGTSSLLSNGAPYARSGTAMCAMMAHGFHIPVIICCETYKFSDRIQLDSFVVNEAGQSSDLLSQEDDTLQTPSVLLTRAECSAQSRLKVVQLLHDVTPPRYVSAIASEVGLSGTESVGVILRDYKSVLFGV
ncbi:unnamed protein product [Malassezia sympodialis ATCC 42132]|uniref:Translation initiation factor eIF2B subunit delta n=1 Tax=Malassezia sympodialis (strain ATCC 42132) TaxID=1230383 RepID=M5ELW9_MALS4|nr:uncharacterized protein MSY001_1317 [Malassezia sympodialis ATCC 42132]CCU98611.1 unnamed protein product [Malassezia sympodialis ATCC 42132]SHO79440.1 Similar to S.cerevisiae protein GCD2 (Delta subunit of the translation initiation factor eIF2B) [Malassezia sympodialis ATCC 42132]|eukprot:XP_018739908.1 uncharacterized protein MSY001_1317 [Malassezia sympodialis ATCC 42132]